MSSIVIVFFSPLQAVIDGTRDYTGWSFYYSNTPRQSGDLAMYDYKMRVGPETVVGDSFSNLLIASQCDYFVGVLGSNWNRLINEFRSTCGRLHAGYVALNLDEV